MVVPVVGGVIRESTFGVLNEEDDNEVAKDEERLGIEEKGENPGDGNMEEGLG